jgi:hypothetical protein
MAKANYHVTRRPDGSWQYRQEGAQRASGIAPTQSAAEQQAKDSARRNPSGGEVTIHRPNGQIRDSDTINRRDPNPPRDTKY